MQEIYFATIYMSVTVFLLCAILLVLQRKKGERSRLILAGILFLSVMNYLMRISAIKYGTALASVVTTAPMLMLGIFMVTTYTMYPIEVISPGWITPKRLLKVYSPLLILILLYLLSVGMGVNYVHYDSLVEMLPRYYHFDVYFRIMLAMMIFLPSLILFFIPYTRKYNNTDKNWIRGYITVVVINSAAYVVVLYFENIYIDTFYYYVSVGGGLYLTYQELYVRLIDKSKIYDMTLPTSGDTVLLQDKKSAGLMNDTAASDSKQKRSGSILFERIDAYMNETHAWRDPDLSVAMLVEKLGTNKTSFAQAIQDGGYSRFSDYLAYYRIREFCKIASQNRDEKVDVMFYEVGYRSRSTAFDHFKKQRGMTTSEYFKTIFEESDQIV